MDNPETDRLMRLIVNLLEADWSWEDGNTAFKGMRGYRIMGVHGLTV
jgi:hypothetical protein